MRLKPYAIAALLFACAFLLLPTPMPAQEPPADELVALDDAIGQLVEPAPEAPEAAPAAEVEPAADEDAGEEPAPEPVSEEAPSEPEQVEEARGPPPALADVHGALIAAITAEASNQVTMDAATDVLDAARQSLIDAEAAHADAWHSQDEHTTGVRNAAQALVDFLTAAYLQ